MPSGRVRPRSAVPEAIMARQLNRVVSWNAGQVEILESIAEHGPIDETLRLIARLVDGAGTGIVGAVVAINPGGQPYLVSDSPLPMPIVDKTLIACNAEFLRLDMAKGDPEVLDIEDDTDSQKRMRVLPFTGIGHRSLGGMCAYHEFEDPVTDQYVTEMLHLKRLAQVALEKNHAVGQFNLFVADERRTLAERLHDEPIQALTALSLLLQRMGLDSDPAQAEAFETARERVDSAAQKMRRMLFELHPALLEEEGLVAAIETYLEETFDDLQIIWSVEDATHVEPDYATSILAFRLVHEALANVAKHSKATHATVSLRTTERLEIDVIDDGTGFDVLVPSRSTPGHLGRKNIESLVQRAAGQIEHFSQPGGGCTVKIRLPLIPEAQDAQLPPEAKSPR